VYHEYGKAVVVSGDGDFACLYEYLAEHQKLLHIMTPNKRYSRLLYTFIKYIASLDALQEKLVYISRRSVKSKVSPRSGGADNSSRSSGRSKP